MNRIDKLFQDKTKSVLSIYFTAGYPELNDTLTIIKGLADAGADLVEIGFPFSDPVADGPVIQASSHQALENGMNLDILFEQLSTLPDTVVIPKILMGYYNTVYQYGIDKFINQCIATGIDGVIIPDLPPEVYVKEYQAKFETANLHFICLVAPQTSPERSEYLQSLTRGFLYRLSMSATTGQNITGSQSIASSNNLTFGKSLDLDNKTQTPVMIGFGIHDRQSFEKACRQANGAIIGTAFIRQLTGMQEDLVTKEEIGGRGIRSGDEKQEPEAENRVLKIAGICKEFIDGIRG